MVAFAERIYGGLHLAVNNAGIGGQSAPTADYPLDGWQNVMDVNLNRVFYCMKYEIAPMLRAGGGAIVNMAFHPRLGRLLGLVGRCSRQAHTRSHQGSNQIGEQRQQYPITHGTVKPTASAPR